MLSRKTLFAATLACMAAAGTSGTALAQPGPGPDGWHHGSSLLDGITLTDSQKTSLQALMKAGRADTRSLHEQMRAIHEKIDATLLSSGSVTEATLAPLVQQQEALMQQMDAKHLSDEIAIRNLLTADQIAKASATHAQLAALHDQEHALRASADPSAAPSN